MTVFTWQDEEDTRRKEEAEAAARESTKDPNELFSLKGWFKDVARGDTDWVKVTLAARITAGEGENRVGEIIATDEGDKEVWNKKFKNLFAPDPDGYDAENYCTGIGAGNSYANGLKPFPDEHPDSESAQLSYSMDDDEAGTQAKVAFFLCADGSPGEIYGQLHPLMF
jgi:hypothetical protein